MAIKLPGFIDIDVNIRQLDTKFLENFDSVTAAALAGGVTMICVMPNTNPQIVDEKTFKLFQEYACRQARCDYALYLGATKTNHAISCEYICNTAGLKMCLLNAYDQMKICEVFYWIKHLLNWPNRALGPIVCEADRYTMAAIILLAHLANRRIHISHVRQKEQILLIRAAKDRGIKVTCDVSPHHLFLSTDNFNYHKYEYDVCSREDQQALWNNLSYIDVFSTDHSAYSKQEKNCYQSHGFPGLETFLPLLLNAVSVGRLTKEDLIKKYYSNPKKIFNLPDQLDTYILVDLDAPWTIPEETIYSKAKWSPFAGQSGKGKVCSVYLRGKLVYRNGKVLGLPGFGKNVRCESYCKFICRCQEQNKL